MHVQALHVLFYLSVCSVDRSETSTFHTQSDHRHFIGPYSATRVISG